MSTPTLYTSTQIESGEQRAQLTRDVVNVLRHCYDLKILGNLSGAFGVPGTLYVQTGYQDDGRGYAMWSITDNGGEFNVALVNHHETMRSMPYKDRFGIVDAGTVAYRIAMVIKGEEVDFNACYPEFVETASDVAKDRGNKAA